MTLKQLAIYVCGEQICVQRVVLVITVLVCSKYYSIIVQTV